MRWLLLAAALVAACGDDANAVIVVELASSKGDGAMECNPSDPEIEPDVLDAEQLHFALCSDDSRPCWQQPDMLVPVQPVEPPEAGVDAAGIFVGRNIAFDADLRGTGPLRIEVIACNGGLAAARGFAHGVRLGESPVNIRLYRYDDVSCAGPLARGDTLSFPEPRAFHAMTALASGDILVYGGVTAAGRVPATEPEAGDWTAMTLEPTVEVYRPSVERFLPVQVADGTFLRAFFTPIVISESEGRATIRVVGGLTAPSPETPVLRFDQSQGRNGLGAPIVLHENAQIAPVVNLVFDAASLTLTVQDVAAGVPRSAFNGVAVTEAVRPDIVVVPGLAATAAEKIQFADIGDVPGWNPTRGPPYAPVPELQDCFMAFMESGVRCQPRTTGRYGHTVTALGGSDVLVWGGNVFLGSEAAVDATTGEILGATRRDVAADGLTMLPASTAFHTATIIADSAVPTRRDVLLAGGLLVGCASATDTACTTGFKTTRPAPEQALQVLRWNGSDLSALPVGGTGSATIFHAATRVAPGQVILTGGALTGFATSGQIRVVRQGASGYEVSSLIPQDLIVPRWGHAAAPLPDNRLLVTGGITLVPSTAPPGIDELALVATAEVVAWGKTTFWDPCAALTGGSVVYPDAGPPDGGVPVFDAGFDAGAPADAGVAGMDAGL